MVTPRTPGQMLGEIDRLTRILQRFVATQRKDEDGVDVYDLIGLEIAMQEARTALARRQR